MLCALRVAPEVNDYWPRFCAHIDFEFLSNEKGEKFVRVLYDQIPINIGGNIFIIKYPNIHYPVGLTSPVGKET